MAAITEDVEVARLRRELAREREQRAEAEQQRDIAMEAHRACLVRIAVLEGMD